MSTKTTGQWEVHDMRECGRTYIAIRPLGTGHLLALLQADSFTYGAGGFDIEAHARLMAAAPELLHALREVVAIVNAAGLLNLSYGVQLGQTSWYVKAVARFQYAADLIARLDGEAQS